MSRNRKNETPVADLVSKLVEDARRKRDDGPSSSLHGARAQLSATLNQAGTLLAQIEQTLPARKPSLLNTVLGLAGKPAPRRRSWFFRRTEADGALLSSGQIEKLLKASAKDGVRLSLSDAVARATEGDAGMECVLPEGASDPVCAPRR
ncbi:MAG: hypothetical protein KJS87_04170 [Alphaproteobacteria bacterium]|nr:hypothetical protein [Alphaproteobacteria bacterium]